MTFEEAQQKLIARYKEYPELGAIAQATSLEDNIRHILAFNETDESLTTRVAHEVRVVLALYAPLSELADNLSESTGISKDKSQKITQMIESIILDSVYDDLLAYSYLWEKQEASEPDLPQADSSVKEKLELRPEGVEQVAKPLTREELLNALSSKRTMASDMARVQQTAPASTKTADEKK